jgi:hypothetical protein
MLSSEIHFFFAQVVRLCFSASKFSCSLDSKFRIFVVLLFLLEGIEAILLLCRG